MVSTWREAFFWLGTQNRMKFTSVEVVVDIQMRRPLADTGNAYGSVKAAIDGLVDAGILPGDGPTVILSIRMNAPRPAPKNGTEFLTVTLIGVPE